MRPTALAAALHSAHPALGTARDWLRTIALAGAGSNRSLAALCGTVCADDALAVVSSLRTAREHARPRVDGDARTSSRANGELHSVTVAGDARHAARAAVGLHVPSLAADIAGGQ